MPRLRSLVRFTPLDLGATFKKRTQVSLYGSAVERTYCANRCIASKIAMSPVSTITASATVERVSRVIPDLLTSCVPLSVQ